MNMEQFVLEKYLTKNRTKHKAHGHMPEWLLAAIKAQIGEKYNFYSPPPSIHSVLPMDDRLKALVKDVIAVAHKADTKIVVKKSGRIRDQNGNVVDSFCFNTGRFQVETTLYAGMAVYRPAEPDVLHLLLLRSDQPESKEANHFPELGTSKDWTVLRECAAQHTPGWLKRFHNVDWPGALKQAAEANAAATLALTSGLRAADLSVIGGMGTAKLQLLDLFAIVALHKTFPPALHPELVHVLLTRSVDDLDEIRRVARAWDLTVPAEALGREIPILDLSRVGDIADAKRAERFVPMTYDSSDVALKVIDEVDRLRATAQGTGEFAKTFSSPPVLIGSSIWSKRSCVEIDLRDVRFEDRELEVGRVLIAELVQKRDTLMEGLRTEWAEFSRHSDILLMSPDRVWFQCFHYAASAVLFPAHFTRAEFQNIVLEADAARLRLREDREARYKRAMNKIREATAETSWVEPNKPKAKEEALELLKGEKAAFLYYPRDIPSLCFTKASLRRLADLGEDEMNDFIAKLQCNRFEVDPSHPVTFAKGEQQRMIRVRAESVSVTKNRGDENGTQSGS